MHGYRHLKKTLILTFSLCFRRGLILVFPRSINETFFFVFFKKLLESLEFWEREEKVDKFFHMFT